MSIEPSPVRSVGPGPAKLDALAEAFETERRLLDELARVLLRQRDGLATNDVGVLDESVYSAQRVFLTLQQVRRQRRTLLRLVAGQEGLQLTDLEHALGPDVPERLITARDELVAGARLLARELEVNRKVIDGAMAVGDQLIRAFTGADERQTVYTSDAESEPGGHPGALLNTRV